jgi:hypothetical protein
MKPTTNHVFIFLLTALFHSATFGQIRGIITGRVIDAKTDLPLVFANVFLNNTTVGIVTNERGEFYLNPTTLGSFEIVISFLGYVTQKIQIVVDKSILNIGVIKLITSQTQLGIVEVTSDHDKEWEKKIKKFREIFLGNDKFAASCTIVNPWVIDFPRDETGNKLIAKSLSPIEIENRALGYKILFHLTKFWQNRNEYSIIGNAQFIELNSIDALEISNWKMNRRKSYQHSVHHLFKSIVEKRISGEGFVLYIEMSGSKSTGPRSSKFYSELGRTVELYDTNSLVNKDLQNGLYKISLKGKVEVHDRKEKPRKRVYDDVFGSVSWISVNNNTLIVNADGVPRNPDDIVVSGDMSLGRIANMLPLDYKPEKVNDLQTKTDFLVYQEQIYVHTDKPYYYPGETIWFKGYINYATPSLRDSLSKTVHIELIDRTVKSVLIAKTVEITNGFFDNDLLLPDTLAAKTYYLRAYTNFNRNFGDENLFIKPIPVLTLTDKIYPSSVADYSTQHRVGFLTIVSDKKVYKPREKITLRLKTKNTDNNPISASLSLSVVDSTQVVPLDISSNILSAYPIKELRAQQLENKTPFQMERGISFSGRFLNQSDKPEQGLINIVQFNPNRFLMAQPDEHGFFSVSDLLFYDSATFSVNAIKAKDEKYGKVEFVKSKVANIDFEEKIFKNKIIKTQFPQRSFFASQSSSAAQMLKAVTVKSSRREEQYKTGYRIKRPYGKPDYVLRAKDINASYGNLLLTLPGKIPGLIVRQVNNDGEGTKWVVYIQRQTSINFPAEVLVTINNAIVTGKPADIIGSIDPNTIESIEVKKGINVLYGSVGGNGIVAIYTKGDRDDEVIATKEIPTMKVQGYSRSRNFNSPIYNSLKPNLNRVDNRSTIYWNPHIVTNDKTGTAEVSFFSSDLQTKYMIVAEGVDKNNNAVRYEYCIKIAK